MSTRLSRAGVAVLLLAVALHLPVKAAAAAVAAVVLGLAAAHPAVVLGLAAVVLLLRSAPRVSHPAVTALAGRRVARFLIGGER